MKKFYIYIILVFLALMPCLSASGQELRLPVVPDTLRAPRERAAYVVEHFWDNMCFADTALCRNKAWMEQNFVNFLSVMPHAPAEAVDTAFAGLLRRAAVDEGATAVVSEPPRPMVVMSPLSSRPWNPATTATFPSARAASTRLGSTLRIRASP